ncbi:MAG: adenine deaminase [Syntrophales bacterium]|jgi:adenine deaminase|nr:adenine deaminase [Syntrophales bacterium]
MRKRERLKNLIGVARGLKEPELVLKGGRVVNVFSGEIITADVALYDGIIAGVGSYEGARVIDATGCYIAPGFIDAHMHLESTMLSPQELAKAVIKHGTTAIMADPHEIANVMGIEGIRFLMDAARRLPVDIYFMLPSCVPATGLETSGAVLSVAALQTLRRHKRVLGLAEMMNYPGVINGDNEALEKLIAFSGAVCDGHAPLLSGRDLNAYIAAGIHSDHECSDLAEAREKLRLGMHIMIRQGTLAKNLKTLLPLVNKDNICHFSLATDDLHPHDLLAQGHLDHLVNLAVEEGLDPVSAIRMVTCNTARYFGRRDVGAVAPGYKADLLILSSLAPLCIRSVIKEGRIVFAQGGLPVETTATAAKAQPGKMGRINIRPFAPGALAVPEAEGKIRVIGLVPEQILTKQLTVAPKIAGRTVVSDVDRDILKLAVFERHQRTGNIGIGFVSGFGLKRGALASSVAHDSHNIIVVGCDDEEMFAAVKAIEKMNGGMTAVCQGQVLASLALPIAGLMANAPLAEVAASWQELRRAAHELGSGLPEPFMALSFLALPVIPELRLTDRGLVDVNLFRHVAIFADA